MIRGDVHVGLENRDYYRGGGGYGGWGIDGVGPVVKYLLIANIVVFLLQIFITREPTPDELAELLGLDEEQTVEFLDDRGEGEPNEKADEDADGQEEGGADEQGSEEESEDRVRLPSEEELEFFRGYARVSVVQQWFELDTEKVVYRAQVWRLVTYAFCHARMSVFHILFNMLFLYWFGKTLESMYGSEEFLLFYLASGVVAALCHIGLALFTDDMTPAIGASGAVMGVVMLYAIHFPRRQIYIFLLIPIEIRFVVALYVIFDLHPVLLTLAGTPTDSGVAHAAHLGGLAFGFAYWRYGLRLAKYWARVQRIRMPRWFGPRRHIRLYDPRQEEPQNDMDDLVDKILQKIHQEGNESLTDVEREVLERASKRYARRGRGPGVGD